MAGVPEPLDLDQLMKRCRRLSVELRLGKTDVVVYFVLWGEVVGGPPLVVPAPAYYDSCQYCAIPTTRRCVELSARMPARVLSICRYCSDVLDQGVRDAAQLTMIAHQRFGRWHNDPITYYDELRAWGTALTDPERFVQRMEMAARVRDQRIQAVLAMARAESRELDYYMQMLERRQVEAPASRRRPERDGVRNGLSRTQVAHVTSQRADDFLRVLGGMIGDD